MYTRQRFSVAAAVQFSWTVFPVVGLWAAFLTSLHVYLGEWVQMPGLVIAVLGTAVSFYLGFKGSAAYGRLWEARQIRGGIVNSSRTWGMYVTTLVSDLHREAPGEVPLAEVHRELVHRHLAWLAALRTQLRRRKPWEHDLPYNNRYRSLIGTFDQSAEVLRGRIAPFLAGDELDAIMAQRNQATQLIQRQAERVRDLYAEGRLEDFRHMELIQLLETFYTLQGKCERIKNFPLPRQYASTNHYFVKIFIFLLPLGLLGSFHADGVPEWFVWATVPGSMLVGWVFYLWDQVLDYSENPFEGLINDIPMDGLSRTIEIDLREMLGETDLPPPVSPAAPDVVM